MSWIKVDTPQTEMYELPETGDVEFTKKAKITVKEGTAGIQNSGGNDARTVILHNDIAVTSKNSGGDAVRGWDNDECTGTLTLLADAAVKLAVTHTPNDSADALAYGICMDSETAGLVLGAVSSRYRQTLTVTSTAKSTSVISCAEASGVYALGSVAVQAEIAAPVTVKAVTQGGTAVAKGFYAGDFSADSLNAALNISAAGVTGAEAAAIESDGDASGEAEGKLTFSGAILKNITVAATTSSKSVGSVKAMAMCGDALRLGGDLRGAVSVKATGKCGANGEGYAYGFRALEEECSVQSILGGITVALSGASGSAAALYAGKSSVTVNGAVNGKISASAAGGDTAKSYAVFAAQGIDITGGIKGAVTVTAQGEESAEAAGFTAQAGSIAITGTWAGKLTATATGKEDADSAAYGIKTGGEDGSVALAAVSGAMAVTATAADGSATAAVCEAEDGRFNSGAAWSGAITAKATSQKDSADAAGLKAGGAGVNTLGTVTGALTVTAGGTSADAFGVTCTADLNVYQWRGKVSVSATAASGAGNAAFLQAQALTAGEISSAITVTAKGTEADAWGIQAAGALTLSGNISNKITVAATASQGEASAVGVAAESLTMTSEMLGTLTVTANGKSGATAAGWQFGQVTLPSGGIIRGKATVTAKVGTALGMQLGWMMGGTAQIDIAATGKEAVGIEFTSVAMMTFQSAKIIAKGSESAFAIRENAMSGGSQSLTLEASTVTGDVALGYGSDTLTLKSGTKLTGNVDLGIGKDVVKIHSGSQLKGNLDNVETVGFVINDMSSGKNALWEGEIDQSWDNVSLTMNISPGSVRAGSIVLMKDTGGDSDWSDTKFKLTLDTLQGGTLQFGTKYIASTGNFDYELKTDKSGSTLLLAVTRK